MRKTLRTLALATAMIVATALPSSASSSVKTGLFRDGATCNGTNTTREGTVRASRTGGTLVAVFVGGPNALGSLDSYYVDIVSPTTPGHCNEIVSTGTATANNDGSFRRRVSLHVPRADRKLILSIVDLTTATDSLESRVVRMAP